MLKMITIDCNLILFIQYPITLQLADSINKN